MQITTYTCDICGRQKGEANHWFKGEAVGNIGFYIKKWVAESSPEDKHICGLECATKAMHKAMET